MATYERREFGTTPQNIATPQGGEAAISLIQQAARQSQQLAQGILRDSLDSWELQTDTAMRQQMEKAFEENWHNTIRLENSFKAISGLGKNAPTPAAREKFSQKFNAMRTALAAKAAERQSTNAREQKKQSMQSNILAITESITKKAAAMYSDPTDQSLLAADSAISDAIDALKEIEHKDELTGLYTFTPYQQMRYRQDISRAITSAAYEAFQGIEGSNKKKTFLKKYELSGGTMLPIWEEGNEEEQESLSRFVHQEQYKKNLALMRSDCEAAAVQELVEESLLASNNDPAKAAEWAEEAPYTEAERQKAAQILQASAIRQAAEQKQRQKAAQEEDLDTAAAMIMREVPDLDGAVRFIQQSPNIPPREKLRLTDQLLKRYGQKGRETKGRSPAYFRLAEGILTGETTTATAVRSFIAGDITSSELGIIRSCANAIQKEAKGIILSAKDQIDRYYEAQKQGKYGYEVRKIEEQRQNAAGTLSYYISASRHNPDALKKLLTPAALEQIMRGTIPDRQEAAMEELERRMRNMEDNEYAEHEKEGQTTEEESKEHGNGIKPRSPGQGIEDWLNKNWHKQETAGE